MLDYLMGGPEGADLIERIDAKMDELPGHGRSAPDAPGGRASSGSVPAPHPVARRAGGR